MVKRVFVKKSHRDSNMELLRIVAMVLIMVLHADFTSLSVPTAEQCYDSFFVSFLRFFIEGLTVVAVNAFVLLSGWYGIKPSFQKMSSFVFQTLFLIFIVYLCFLCVGIGERHSVGEWLKIVFFNQYWFVQSYIILYVFSPILNSFVENGNKRTLEKVLVLLFIIQLLWGYFPYSSNYGWYNDGYSPLSFFFLYLLARYLRLYVKSVKQRSTKYYLLWWLFFALAVALLAYISVCLGFGGYYMLYLFGYSSPMVIMGSLSLLLLFSRISFSNSLVNRIAVSAYAIYIIHCHECIFLPIYVNHINYWFFNDVLGVFIVKTSIMIAFIFVVAIILDNFRILIWMHFLKLINYSLYGNRENNPN